MFKVRRRVKHTFVAVAKMSDRKLKAPLIVHAADALRWRANSPSGPHATTCGSWRRGC